MSKSRRILYLKMFTHVGNICIRHKRVWPPRHNGGRYDVWCATDDNIFMHSSHQHPIEIRNILLTLSLIEYHIDFGKENVFGFPIQ